MNGYWGFTAEAQRTQSSGIDCAPDRTDPKRCIRAYLCDLWLGFALRSLRLCGESMPSAICSGVGIKQPIPGLPKCCSCGRMLASHISRSFGETSLFGEIDMRKPLFVTCLTAAL